MPCAALGDHHPPDGLAAQEDAGQVHVDDLLPAAQRRVLDGVGPGRAGVVHQHVDAAEAVAGLGDEAGHVVGGGDVAGEPRAAHAALALEVGGGPLAALAVASADDDVRAQLGERVGHLQADAGGAAGDDRDAAVEVEQIADVHPATPCAAVSRARSRSTCFCTLPVAVFGSASTSSKDFGSLCRASRAPACSRSPSSVGAAPSRATA